MLTCIPYLIFKHLFNVLFVHISMIKESLPCQQFFRSVGYFTLILIMKEKGNTIIINCHHSAADNI